MPWWATREALRTTMARTASARTPSVRARFRLVSPRSQDLSCTRGNSARPCWVEPVRRPLLHAAVHAVAMRIHRDDQRAEVLHPKLPEAFGHQVFPPDLLDLLD